MKKRILSMLLLVAMVVTALPLVALPAVAAEGATEDVLYTEEDYDALYVKDGLFFSMDFFSTNEYWNNAPVDLNVTNASGQTYLDVSEKGALASFVNYKEGSFNFGINGYIQGIAENGGLRLLNSSGSIWLNMGFANGQMTNTDYNYTVENVFRYGATTSVNQFYHRQNWFAVAVANPATENATITFQKMMSQFNTYGTSNGANGLFSFWNTVHTFGAQPKVTVGTGANTLSFVYRLGEYVESATSPIVGTVPAVELYMPGETAPVFSVSSLASQLLKTNPDCLKQDGTYDTDADPGHYGVDPASIRAGWTDRIGYGGFDGYTYAVRYYRRALTQGETLRNHFADLAKFYHLDLSRFEDFTEAEMQELYTLAANYSIDSDRETVARALYAVATERYSTQFDAAIIAAAKEYLLDLTGILGIPRGVLPTTYSHLAALAAGTYTGADADADYKAAIKADIEAYADATHMTAADYNALYATDGLVYAIDFYASNAHWGGAPKTYTANADWKTDLATYEWKNIGGIAWGALSSDKTITVGNGYLDLRQANDIQITGLGNATGNGFASKGGATAEQVMLAIGGGYMFNNVRMYFSTSSHALSTAEVQNNGFQFLKNSPTYNGQKITTNAFTTPVTLAMVMSVTDPTLTLLWGATKLNDGTSLGTYVDANGKNKDYTAANKKTAYAVKYIEVEGEQVLAVTTGTATSVEPFFQPTMQTAAKVEYDLNGNKLAAPLENVLVFFPDEQTTPGFFGIYENGNTLYEDAENPYLNNTTAYDCVYPKWSSCTADIYALRYYNRTLTSDELASNHFVDIVKFFRLNIAGYESLSKEAQAEVIKAFETVQFTDDRLAVQEFSIRTLSPLLKESYDALKVEGEDERNSFLDLAGDYALDISDVLESTRDVSEVYRTVTDGALIGKSTAEAQRILDKAYSDTYFYYSYAKEGDAEWQTFLTSLAAANVNAEALMALPWRTRRAAVTVAPTQEKIDEYVAKALEAYADYATGDIDYADLYVTDGLVYSVDFFKMNKYWNTHGTDYTPPLAPAYDPTYWEDTNGNGVPDPGEMKANAGTAGAFSADFLKAYNAWRSQSINTHGSEYDYLAQFENIENSMYMYSYFNLSADPAYARAYYEVGEGYLKLVTHNNSNGGFQLSGAGSYLTTNVSQQIIMSPQDTLASSFTIFYNVRPTVSYDGTIVSMSSVGGAMSNVTVNKKSSLTVGGVMDYTLTLKTDAVVANKATTNGRVTVRTEDGLVADFSGTYTRDDSMYLGWSHNADMKLYAYRQYNSELTQEEIEQNHLADIFKWFRLDLAPYATLSETERIALRTRLLAFDIETSSREAVLAAYAEVIDAHYTELGLEELDAEFAELAKACGFHDERLALLKEIRETKSVAALLKTLTDDFKVGYSLNAAVVCAEYDAAIAFLDSIGFYGVQVRLETGDPANEMPGVRSLFKIDENALKALLLSAEERGEEVVLGATVEMKVGDTVYTHPIYFYPVLDAAGNVSFRADSAKLQTITTTNPADEFLGFAYTVTYKNYATYSAEQAYTHYNTEYDYSFFVKVGNNTFTRDVEYSQFEGGTVSAYKAYNYFYEAGEYLDDDMLGEVIGKGAKAPSAATE